MIRRLMYSLYTRWDMGYAASTFRQAPATDTDREVDRALQVVHDRFGGDLREFFSRVRNLRKSVEPEAAEIQVLLKPIDKSCDQSKS